MDIHARLKLNRAYNICTVYSLQIERILIRALKKFKKKRDTGEREKEK